MRAFSDLIICEHCDSVFRVRVLARGEVARCSRCGAVLFQGRRVAVEGTLALVIAAAVAFVVANVYPVLRIGLQGLHTEATLWQSALALAYSPAAPIALAAALVMIVAPLVQIVGLHWLLVHAYLGRRAPGFTQWMHLLVKLQPWSMVEVGLLGVLVSVIKLSSVLDVAPGIGVWGMATQMILMALIAHRDLHWLWEATAADSAHQTVVA